ncbi:SdpI family protein [Hujiaoplasma nucleasis]|uniref:SdpI family protein n=1 Tax=Hujiaoplasma nucleasis TaxID=2725268 RepID=A0A7L6N175_9MOLU|nr:SdpI family protein [Hujiaoplasma nucleasis]QLY40006.1 SdpI family protein [Hujiaoplasma nucleasis]
MLYWTIIGVWIFLETFVVLKIILGIIFFKFTPKRNGIFGFRTEKSLSSEKIWKIANVEFGKLFIFFGVIELFTSLSTLGLTFQGFERVDETIIPLIYLLIYIITTWFTVIFVIRKIKNIDN